MEVEVLLHKNTFFPHKKISQTVSLSTTYRDQYQTLFSKEELQKWGVAAELPLVSVDRMLEYARKRTSLDKDFSLIN